MEWCQVLACMLGQDGIQALLIKPIKEKPRIVGIIRSNDCWLASSPAKMVPRRIIKNVLVSTHALAFMRSCLGKVAGSIEYLTGPKKADCEPMRNTQAIKLAK